MRTRTYILGALVALLVCAGVGAWFVLRGTQDTAVSNEGTHVVAPGFSLPNAEGQSVVLEDIQAPVRVVHFWASWSPYSKEALPALVELKRAFGEQVAVIALDRDTDPATGRAFLASLQLGDELVFAYDAADTYFKKLGGYNMPETVFLAPDGSILKHVHGPMSYEKMHETVSTLLAAGS